MLSLSVEGDDANRCFTRSNTASRSSNELEPDDPRDERGEDDDGDRNDERRAPVRLLTHKCYSFI